MIQNTSKKMKLITIIGIVVLFIVIADNFIGNNFRNQLTISSYAFYVIWGETVVSVTVWMLAINILYVALNNIKTIRIRDIKDKYKIIGEITIAIVVIIINLLLPLSHQYDGVEVAGKRPSKIEYYSLLMKDMISKETERVNIPSDQIYIGRHMITRPSGRVRKKVTVYDIYYTGKDNQNYSYYITEDEKRVFDLLLETYDDLTLTYYKNTGFLESVNGVRLSDKERIVKQIAIYKTFSK